MSRVLQYNGHMVAYGGNFQNAYDQYNPLRLPDYTARLEYEVGDTPTYASGVTAVQVSTNPNIWDVTYANTNWNGGVIVGSNADLIRVLGLNSTHVEKMKNAFGSCTHLVSVAPFDTRKVHTMEDLFASCSSLTVVPQQFDACSCTTLFGMFEGCSALTTAPMVINTAGVTTTQNMFLNCRSLVTVPMYDMSNVVYAHYMFYGCSSLVTVPLFDTSKVKNMEGMFYECSSLGSIPLFSTASCTDMDDMFYECRAVTGGALALYQQASQQSRVPTHMLTFHNCGADTTTGAAELAQIPSSWK